MSNWVWFPSGLTRSFSTSFAEPPLAEASRVHHQFSRGIFTLDIIAKTAAYLGILCTSFTLIVFLSRGISGDRRALAPAFALGFGEALIPIALGLAVALFAELAQNAVTTRLEQLDLEMHAAILELVNSLSRLRFLTNFAVPNTLS